MVGSRFYAQLIEINIKPCPVRSRRKAKATLFLTYILIPRRSHFLYSERVLCEYPCIFHHVLLRAHDHMICIVSFMYFCTHNAPSWIRSTHVKF